MKAALLAVAACALLALWGCGEEPVKSPEQLTQEIQSQNRPGAPTVPEEIRNKGFSGQRGPGRGSEAQGTAPR